MALTPLKHLKDDGANDGQALVVQADGSISPESVAVDGGAQQTFWSSGYPTAVGGSTTLKKNVGGSDSGDASIKWVVPRAGTITGISVIRNSTSSGSMSVLTKVNGTTQDTFAQGSGGGIETKTLSIPVSAGDEITVEQVDDGSLSWAGCAHLYAKF